MLDNVTELTPELIAELRRLEREATPGKWPHIYSYHKHQDADFIVAMRNALNVLLDAAEARLAESDTVPPEKRFKP